MKNRILKIVCAAALFTVAVVMSAVVSAAAVSVEGMLPFEDVNSAAWYSDAVEFCYANKAVKGMNEYTFAPLAELTRAQFVTILANIGKADVSVCETDRFGDVKAGHWYYNSVSWAYESGIVSGTSEHTFSPNAPVTREALSRIIALYMQNKGIAVEISDSCLDNFNDRDKISDWAIDSVKYTVSAGLISGVKDDVIDPKGNVTRAQAARIFMLYMQSYASEAHEHVYSEAGCTGSAYCTVCGIKSGMPLGHDMSEGFSCKSGAQSKCLRCGYWVSSSSMPHSYAPATCGRPETCVRCSAQRGGAVGEHSWWAATCKNPKMCKVCYKTEGSALGHSWVRADCINPKTCTRCKTTEGSALSTNGQHTWWSATCKNPKMCKVCYKTEGSALGHSWVRADCIVPKTCTRCKTTEGNALTTTKQHTWWAATCKNPKMCKVCYKTEGSALGHSWRAADCTAPKTCTRCKSTEGSALSTSGQHSWTDADCTKPKTCKVCGKTEGSALGHKWKEGSCTEPRTCTVCRTKEGKVQGHSFRSIDGIRNCSKCGAPENPNGKTVYLTFDDGPGKYTESLLNTLDRYDVKVTFFVVDTGYMHLLPRMAEAGHTVAMHSETHTYNKIYASENAFFNDLYAIQSRILEYTGKLSKILRFPGGSSNGVSRFNPGIMTRLTKKLKEMGYRYFDWNVDSNDAGGTRTSSGVYSNVINGIKRNQNSIVLQHDIKGYSVEAVDDIIIWGLKNGYTFKALDMDSPVCEHYVNN